MTKVSPGDSMQQHFIDWLRDVLPLLMKNQVRKLEQQVAEGAVSAYWAGTVLRIDLKVVPKSK